MRESTLLIAQCGDTYPSIRETQGNFDDWFMRCLPDSDLRVEVWNAHCAEPAPEADLAGIIVTGSPAMVTDRAHWSEQLSQWLRQQVEKDIPVLGVCYGHQLLADTLGGRVDYQESGREIGSLLVTTSPAARHDPLFARLPATFNAHLTHAQSVLGLPRGAELLASSSQIQCQAYRVGRHHWGVQFHPEFTRDIMAAYLEVYHDQIQPSRRYYIENHLHDCPEAALLIRYFAEYCQGSGDQ